MLRTGLTGGTGSGKSTVARRLGERGAVVVDADVLAREVVSPGSEGLAAVVEEFGPGLLTPDGALDRAALAAVVFSDPGRRQALEAITHPLIARRTGELVAAAADDAVLVHDVPLLVEKSMGPGYHLVVVVDAPVQDRVRRLVGRGMPEDDARRRIASQATDEQRRAAADVWIDNAGTTADLERAADRLWDERLVPFRDHLLAGTRATVLPVAGGVGGSEPAEGAGRRLLDRVLLALGPLANAPTAALGSSGQPVDVVVGVPSGADPAALDAALRRAGFALEGAADGERVYGSCDPGGPAVVRLRPAG